MSRSMTAYQAPPAAGVGGPLGQYLAFGQMSRAFNGALTRSADTGQINFSTIASVSGSGYEIFALTDSLQQTKPLYLKLIYTGTSVNAQVGTATSGSGTLSGITSSNTALFTTNATAGTTRYCYASSGDGTFMTLFCNVQAPGATVPDGVAGLILERTRDADGTANGNGFMLYRWTAGNLDVGAVTANYLTGVQPFIYDPQAGQPAASFDIGAFVPQLVNTVVQYPTATTAGQTFAYPVYGYNGVQPQGASKALTLLYAADNPRMGPVSVPHYGTTMQFMSMGGGPTSFATQMSVATMTAQTAATAATVKTQLVSPAFRWE